MADDDTDKPERVERCGAKTRTTGEPCRRYPIKGRARCKTHGGLTPQGQHKGNRHATRHGIYSRQFSDDELALIPELRETVGNLEDEIILCRLQLRRIVELDDRIRTGEVQAGMRLSEMRRIQRQRQAGTTEDGEPVMDAPETEDHIIRKVPDTQADMLRWTGRIQNLTIALHTTHVEHVERLKAKLVQRIGEVEEEKRRLQQFSIIQGGRQA